MGGLARIFAALFLHAVPLDDKSLPHMREVQVVIELRGGPYLAGFDPPMIRGSMVDVVWLLAVLKKELEVSEE